MTEANLSQEVVNAINDQIYFTPDAKEQIEAALKARQLKGPQNRKERRTLMKKMGKKNYNEFMTISETAAKLDYIDLIQKLRELNKKKENEVYEDEDSEEEN